MRGVGKQLTILEKEARGELWLGGERDSLGGVNSCVVFAPINLLSGGEVGSNGQLWGKQELRKYIFIFEEYEKEDGRGDVGEEEERCQMENLHGGDARRVGVRGKRGTRYVWGGGREDE